VTEHHKSIDLEIKIIYIQRGFSISVSLPEGIPRSQVNFLWFSLPCYQRFTKSGKFLVGGFSPTPLKNDGVKVSWDDDIPFPTVSGKS